LSWESLSVIVVFQNFPAVHEDANTRMSDRTTLYREAGRRSLYPDRVGSEIHVADITVLRRDRERVSHTCGRNASSPPFACCARNETTRREEKRPFAQPYHVRNPSTGLISRVWPYSCLLYLRVPSAHRWFISGLA